MRYQSSLLLTISFLVCILPVYALKRTIGPANDQRFLNASRICNITWPADFEYSLCSVAINCVYENLSQAFIANLGSGTAIASLLPTILALIGSPPLELVQLALVSPHRALATCCFSIGLPSGLFRQLRPLHSQLAQVNWEQPSVREWTLPLPAPSTKKWRNIVGKIVIDCVIFSLASIMLWQNWRVNSFTMIPWRCEYSYLLFAWPIACMIWVIIAVALLHCFKKSAEVFHTGDPTAKYTILQLMLLPYRFGPDQFRHRLNIEPPPKSSENQQQTHDQISDGSKGIMAAHASANTSRTSALPLPSPVCPSRSKTALTYDQDCVTVRITMHSNFGFRSWRCFEAIIECLALGIYIYATFILTSTLFMDAEHSITYVTVMAICLSGVRILETLF